MVIALVEHSDEGRLPVYLTRFFGRDAELDTLTRVLADPAERMVTLAGPAGVGKTRLLIEAIERSGCRSSGEIVFVDGTTIERPALLLPELVNVLGIERPGDQLSGELLSEHLAGRQLTLLLDNMEHLLPAATDIAALLRALTGLRIVATSRSPLRISGERILDIEPFSTNAPAAGALSVAGQLFVDRASKTGKLPEVGTAEIATIESICAQLDGVPLAIELAAARLRVLSLPALQAVLTNQLAVLTGGPVDVSERHRTLRAAIRWSYDLLGHEEQRLLNELGVFTESFALAAVNAVCSPASTPQIDLLESLFDHALLMRSEDDFDGQPRFRLLIAIRDFALEQLSASRAEEQLRIRHAAWFLQLAESLEPSLTGPGQQVAVWRLTRTTPNLRQALNFMVRMGDQESALRMVAALARYWLIRVQWQEARAAFETVFALGAPVPTRVWGTALRGAAIIAESQYDNESARDWNTRAISIWEELAEPHQVARSRIDLGNVFNNLGRYEDGLVEFERAAELVDPVIDPRTHLVALGSIAITFLRQGLLREADEKFTGLAPRLRALDDPWLLAACLSNFGVVKQRLGQLPEARDLFAEGLRIRRELEDDYGTASTLINLGSVQQDPAAGAAMSLEALEIGLRIGAADVVAAARVDQAVAAFDRGDRATAATAYLDALEGYSSLGDDVQVADVLGLMAELIESSDPDAAVRLLGAAESAKRDHGVDPTGPIAERIGALSRRLLDRLGEIRYRAEVEAGRNTPLAGARIDALKVTRAVAFRPDSTSEPRKRGGSVFGGLTVRELDVLRLIAEGKTDRQIAGQLFITPKTANHHVTRILAKLECHNRAAATALAFQHGIV